MFSAKRSFKVLAGLSLLVAACGNAMAAEPLKTGTETPQEASNKKLRETIMPMSSAELKKFEKEESDWLVEQKKKFDKIPKGIPLTDKVSIHEVRMYNGLLCIVTTHHGKPVSTMCDFEHKHDNAVVMRQQEYMQEKVAQQVTNLQMRKIREADAIAQENARSNERARNQHYDNLPENQVSKK